MRAAFLYMGRSEHQEEYGYDMFFYDNSIYVDAYFLMFNNLLHRHFDCSQLLRYDHADPEVTEEYLKYIDESYKTMCLYVLNFYNNYLKNKKEGYVFINCLPEENGISEKMMTMQSRKGYKIPPKEAQFFHIIKNQGVTKEIEIYREAKAIDPELIIFSENGLNVVGYEFLIGGKVSEAIEVFKLNVEAYPEAYNSYDSLGEAYLANGDIDLAKKNYKKSLEFNPDNNNARKILKKLTKE